MTHKTPPTAHAEITAPISADLRRIEQSAHPASDRDTHFFLAGWNGARQGDDSHTAFRSAKRYAPASPALQAAPPAPQGEKAYEKLPEPAATGLGDEYESFDSDGRAMGKAYKTILYFTADQMRTFADATSDLRSIPAPAPAPAAVAVPAASEVLDALNYVDDFVARCNGDDRGSCASVNLLRAALAAAPVQEHATQHAGQGQAYSIDADLEGIRAHVAEAITAALASGAKKSDRPSDEHWLRPFWMHAYFAAVQYNALRDSAEAMLNVPGALTQAARDVLAERARQVDAEGFNHARDDEYVGRQLAGAAASYLILAAGGREDEARAVWPWRQEWLKPSDQRRYLEKAGALALAEMERLDRAAARAAQGGA